MVLCDTRLRVRFPGMTPQDPPPDAGRWAAVARTRRRPASGHTVAASASLVVHRRLSPVLSFLSSTPPTKPLSTAHSGRLGSLSTRRVLRDARRALPVRQQQQPPPHTAWPARAPPCVPIMIRAHCLPWQPRSFRWQGPPGVLWLTSTQRDGWPYTRRPRATRSALCAGSAGAGAPLC